MLPNLKKLRKEKHLSQQKLAEMLATTQQSINQYENNHVEPDIEMLIKLADCFETSIDYIVGHTDIRRRIEHTEVFHLNDLEANCILGYRQLKETDKQCVNTVIHALLNK